MEVHVTTSTRDISAFLGSDRATNMCFRCGEPGHLRYQCLSYKVRLCWNHTQTGHCPNEHCNFAHGVEELRQPWKMRCVRVVKQEGQLLCIGCNSTEHTFRKCPLHRDLVILE